jgi:organic radical activating enzyme
MLRRIDRLAELGTTVIAISGGEPLLHPELDDIIRLIRRRSSIATLITNGYLLTPDRIQRLNHVGLDHLQSVLGYKIRNSLQFSQCFIAELCWDAGTQVCTLAGSVMLDYIVRNLSSG